MNTPQTNVDTSIAILTHRVETMHEEFGEVRAVLREMADTLGRLALIEERQAQTGRSMERAFVLLEKMELRVAALEAQAPATRQTNDWVGRAVWAAAAAGVTFMAKKVGLI